MNFNPHTEACRRLRAEIDSSSSLLKAVTAEVDWYLATNPQVIRENVAEHEARAAQSQREVCQLDEKIEWAKADCVRIQSKVGTLLNPKNWFATDQRDLRRSRDALRKTCVVLADQKLAEEARMSDTRQAIATLALTLRKYEQFDIVGRQKEQSDLQAVLRTKTGELSRLTDLKNRVDDVLRPVVGEMQQLQSRKDAAERQLSSARDIEHRLSNASNSYQRALAHEECERQFGDGRPRGVIAKLERELRRIESDYGKAVRRAEHVGQKAARVIKSIVVDGNNLCYESQRFIGVVALVPLVKALSADYSVLVVFDSAIRRMLRVDDTELQTWFGNHAKVHVVASKQLADETILDVASSNGFTYVVSNDRFGDFSEKSAVRDGRIIRHEIVGGHVFVHDLHVKTTYQL